MYAGTSVGDVSELLTLQEDSPPLVDCREIWGWLVSVSMKVSHLVAVVAALSEGMGEPNFCLHLSNCSRNDHHFNGLFS